MTITIVDPTVGGDNNAWGTKLNTALTALSAGVEDVNTVATASTAQTLLPTINDLTLTSSSCALTLPTATAGTSLLLILRQDATGGRVVTYTGTAPKWPSGIQPTLTGTASSVDLFTFVCVASGTWMGVAAGYDLR